MLLRLKQLVFQLRQAFGHFRLQHVHFLGGRLNIQVSVAPEFGFKGFKGFKGFNPWFSKVVPCFLGSRCWCDPRSADVPLNLKFTAVSVQKHKSVIHERSKVLMSAFMKLLSTFSSKKFKCSVNIPSDKSKRVGLKKNTNLFFNILELIFPAMFPGLGGRLSS